MSFALEGTSTKPIEAFLILLIIDYGAECMPRSTKYKRRTRVPATKKTTTTEIPTTTTDSSERKVWPYNVFHQYYVTETISTMFFTVFYVITTGGEPPFVSPYLTEEEKQRRRDKLKGRANNTKWCTCGSCVAMPTDEESVCCKEAYYFERHANFLGVCYGESALTWMQLRPLDLDSYRQKFLSKPKLLVKYEDIDFYNTSSNELWRWLAYRKILQRLNYLTPALDGKFNGTYPSCVVNKVREEYSEESGTYKPIGWFNLTFEDINVNIKMPH